MGSTRGTLGAGSRGLGGPGNGVQYYSTSSFVFIDRKGTWSVVGESRGKGDERELEVGRVALHELPHHANSVLGLITRTGG